jgi:hypothetical protein
MIGELRLTKGPNKKAESAIDLKVQEDNDHGQRHRRLIEASRVARLIGKTRTFAFLG